MKNRVDSGTDSDTGSSHDGGHDGHGRRHHGRHRGTAKRKSVRQSSGVLPRPMLAMMRQKSRLNLSKVDLDEETRVDIVTEDETMKEMLQRLREFSGWLDDNIDDIRGQKHTQYGVLSGEEAWIKLLRGNQRYLCGDGHTFLLKVALETHQSKRHELANHQNPFAVVVACSDSRVPLAMLFNQGVGDIFVIRLAGNVVDPLALGSIEYGMHHLGAKLLVVLGHTGCGAVTAAFGYEGSDSSDEEDSDYDSDADEVTTAKPSDKQPVREDDEHDSSDSDDDNKEACGHGHVPSILRKISPACDWARAKLHIDKSTDISKLPSDKRSELINVAVRRNVYNVLDEIIARSPLVDDAIKNNDAKIVCAQYDLLTGRVDEIGEDASIVERLHRKISSNSWTQ